MPTSKYRVCPTCSGEGKTVNPALSIWTGADIDADPEGFESMLAGHYDVTCQECGGQRVVTATEHRAYAARRQDHFTMLGEQGIFPGSPDYF